MPTPQDVPRGFNPMAQTSYWFEEYKQKFFRHFELPIVKNPSNAVVYVNERYGVRLTNNVVDVAIRTALPTSKEQVFLFYNVPVD